MALVVLSMAACSNISGLEPEEQLFTGLKPIAYRVDSEDGEGNTDYLGSTKAEVEAALAITPNGAFFGSSYYRTLPYSLWIYNALHKSRGKITKWVCNTFGNEPVVLSNVNPELRVSVAENVLQNNGYFRADVDYDVLYGKPKTTKRDSVARPRTAKVAYKVTPGTLFTLDSIAYCNFPEEMYEVDFMADRLLHKGDPFNVEVLDNERTRLYNLFRNHGFYYYQQPYTTYLADTTKVADKVQLRLNVVDSLPEEALMRWVIASTRVNIMREYQEQITDSVKRNRLTISFGGKKSPLRPRVILQDVKMRPGTLFSQDSYQESLSNLAAKGIYSSVGIEFTPRRLADGTLQIVADSVGVSRDTGEKRAGAGLLDMTLNCVLDKPYDLSLQANYLGKASGRMGPGVALGFAKRNAFRGGEILNVNLAANYEVQISGQQKGTGSYEISGDVGLTMPRLLVPQSLLHRRHRWQTTPQTQLTFSYETISRSNFFRRHILSGEMAYNFQPTMQSKHVFTPIMVEYDRLAEFSDGYANAIISSPIMLSSLNDYFLTKMRYTYLYSSPTKYRNPIFWSVTVTEASHLLALGYLAAGHSWLERDKTAFKTPFSQFVKVETEWRKTWQVDEGSSVVAHVQAGAIKAWGNSRTAPFSERFFIGGANSLRGFTARSIGPGRYHNANSKFSYLTNVGDMKLVMNLEYRPRLFGSLYGALFLDAGNIWNLRYENEFGLNEDIDSGIDPNLGQETKDYIDKVIGDVSKGTMRPGKFFGDIAVNVGVGVRYDLDFFVLRLDWGLALHSPYATGKGGYFNLPSFGKAQCLNFAIGYPF